MKDEIAKGPVTTEGYPRSRRSADSESRPSGETPLFWGAILIIVGIVATVLSFTLDRDLFLPLLLIGGSALNIGVIAVVTGYIVKAISFLPGKSPR